MIQGLQANLAFENKPEGQLEAAESGGPLLAWSPQTWPVATGWDAVVAPFLAGAPGQRLAGYIEQRLAQAAVIYPAQPFRALELTALAAVRVVILGQDPYHGPGQAHGLAFSVPEGVKPPPSLRNIFKELARDPGVEADASPGGRLESWARQGVLLLNTCLTVEQAQPASHAGRGWETLTDGLIGAVSARAEPVVFMLWGAHAQSKQALIASHHLVLKANHPSPLSALRPPLPFLGCGHFGAANDFFRARGKPPLRW